MDINIAIPIQSVTLPAVTYGDVALDILRLDLIHPAVAGNKWFKLQENISQMRAGNYSTLLTFGGAYSNHLSATAAACKAHNIPCIGIVRGEELQEDSNATLQFCTQQGMQLVFVSRAVYDLRYDATYWQALKAAFGPVYIVPEGGNNAAGRAGIAAIAQYIQPDYDYIALSVGTGTTLLGLSDHIDKDIQLVGYIPMKSGTGYAGSFVTQHANWTLRDLYHFGGFGKKTEALILFMRNFFSQYEIPLDVVYTGKMMYGLLEDIKQGYYKPGTKILSIHTGGLQGNAAISGLLNY